MQVPVNTKTCFGCDNADICYLCPMCNDFHVPQAKGYAKCIGFSMYKEKPLKKEDAICGKGE